MSFDFLVPHYQGSDEHRAEIFYWNLQRINHLFPKSKFITGSDDSPFFNRSKAINNAARKSDADIFCILDADTVFNIYTLCDALRYINAGGYHVRPYDKYYRMDQASGKKLLEKNPKTILNSTHYTYDYVLTDPPTQYEEPVSGLLMMHRDTFYEIGGFPENFVGWGYEDRAFIKAADTIMGGRVRLPGEVFHIWHPELQSHTWNQPNISSNKDLCERILSISNPDEMHEVYGRWV